MRTTGAREFNHLIDVYETVYTDDGFGGFTSDYNLLATVWAKVKNESTSSAFSKLGTTDGKLSESKSIMVSVRPELINYDAPNMQIEYKNERYAISSTPIKTDDKHLVQFIATLI